MCQLAQIINGERSGTSSGYWYRCLPGGLKLYQRWIFGYKLHLTDQTGDLVWPLTADVTMANVQDNQMYVL